nr:hypothetical protein [Halomonas sp.]
MRRIYTPTSAASGVEDVLKMLEGRWKLIILFHLFECARQSLDIRETEKVERMS